MVEYSKLLYKVFSQVYKLLLVSCSGVVVETAVL